MNLAALILIVRSDAHVGDLIDTLDGARTGDGLAIEGTFGLLVDGGDGLDWICHEAITEPGAITAPRYVTDGSGRWLSRLADLNQAKDGFGVFYSEDLCTWTGVDALRNRVVSDVAFAPDGSIWAATADAEGGNALFHGADAASLAPVYTTPNPLQSVAVGAGVWATASVDDAPVLLFSADGETFTEHALPSTDVATDATVEVAHPSDATAWVVLDPIGEDALLEVTGGGATVSVLWEAPDRITDVERSPDGQLFVTLGERRPWSASPPSDLVELADASGVDASNGLLLANRTFVNGLLFTESADGLTPARTELPSTIRGVRECSAGTETATACEPLWDVLAPRLEPVVDTGTPPRSTVPDTGDEDAPRCGCQTGSTSLLLMSAAALLMRRRRKAAPGPALRH